jgi:hypothetical protein
MNDEIIRREKRRESQKKKRREVMYVLYTIYQLSISIDMKRWELSSLNHCQPNSNTRWLLSKTIHY